MVSEMFFLAEASTAASEVAKEVASTSVSLDWKAVLWGLVGAAVLRGIQWLADFATKGGQKKLIDLLAEALKKSNDTAIGSQIQADDAIVKTLENMIPVVLDTLSENLKNDLKNGKIDKDQWERIYALTWAKAKPVIVGGTNDYLKNSSWNDGLVVAKFVWEKWIAKKKESGKE